MGKIAPTWTIDGFSFSGEVPYHYNPDEYDSNGWASIVTKENGWINGPKPRTNRTSRANGDGSYRGPSYVDERIITLEGSTWTRTPQDRERAELALSGMCADGAELYEFTRSTDTVRQTLFVELDDQPMIEMVHFLELKWSFQFCAPDPRKYESDWQQPITHMYAGGGRGLDFSGGGLDIDPQFLDFGAVNTNTGTVQVFNRGTASSSPLFVIDGPAVNPQVFEPSTGTTLRFAGTLGPNDILTINCDTNEQRGVPGRGVFVNGARRRGSLSLSGAWPFVDGGEIGFYSFVADAYSPEATMQCFFRSVWR